MSLLFFDVFRILQYVLWGSVLKQEFFFNMGTDIAFHPAIWITPSRLLTRAGRSSRVSRFLESQLFFLRRFLDISSSL